MEQKVSVLSFFMPREINYGQFSYKKMFTMASSATKSGLLSLVQLQKEV